MIADMQATPTCSEEFCTRTAVTSFRKNSNRDVPLYPPRCAEHRRQEKDKHKKSVSDVLALSNESGTLLQKPNEGGDRGERMTDSLKRKVCKTLVIQMNRVEGEPPMKKGRSEAEWGESHYQIMVKWATTRFWNIPEALCTDPKVLYDDLKNFCEGGEPIVYDAENAAEGNEDEGNGGPIDTDDQDNEEVNQTPHHLGVE